MKKKLSLVASLLIIITMQACSQRTKTVAQNPSPKNLSNYSVATFASGCFWCMEGVYESVKGVQEVVSGYSGGKEANPTYEQVGAHETGHAESVQVYYDSSIVTYSTLLKVYFASQDPTQVNGQGPDHGEPYRSVIFYRNASEKLQAQKYITQLQPQFNKPIAAMVVPYDKFWEAEGYHQDYIKHNPNVGYVRQESIPRIKRFQQRYPDLIKPDRKL